MKFNIPHLFGFILGVMLACASTGVAQQTNTHTGHFTDFQNILEKNIFDPSRSGRLNRVRGNAPKPRQVDVFSLVGTMSYTKGSFAFFDGSSSDFKKVVEPEAKIANYTVTSISRDAVTLDSGTNKIEMKIGSRMRREDYGPWRLLAESEWQPEPIPTAGAPPAAGSAPSSSSDSSMPMNDRLKKLMEQREQELK